MIRAYSILAVMIVIAMIGWSYRPPTQTVRSVGGIRVVQRLPEVPHQNMSERYANVRYWFYNIVPASSIVLGLGCLAAYLCKLLNAHSSSYQIFTQSKS